MEGSVQLENEALAKEFAWLMETEFQTKFRAIGAYIEECAKQFSVVLNPSSGIEHRPILITAPNQGDAVLCTATIDGDKISKADMTLKLPGRVNKPIKTSIKEHGPWKLKQIQDSANYFMKARQKYSHLQYTKDTFRRPGQIRKAFEEVAEYLRQAEGIMVLPKPTSMQEIYTTKQREQLKPDLPEDVALHFHISSANLVLTILTVTHTTRPALARPATAEMDSVSWVGMTFDHGSNTYEVSNQIQVRAPVPWLAAVLKLLQETLEITQDLVDKVKVFETLGLSLPPQPKKDSVVC